MSTKGRNAPARPKKKRKPDEEAGEHSERWLLTYADMITLLLALFVVLFAMSTISVKKFMEFRTGVVQAFSPQINNFMQGGTGILQQNSLVSRPGSVPSPSPMSTSSSASQMVTIEHQLQSALTSAGLSASVNIVPQQRGIAIRILTDKVFFGTDSADLGTVGNQIVDVIASVISPIPNDISIEGNTDNQPIVGGPYHSNFELSAMRAVSVLERLVNVDHVAADRLSATGYGSTRPIAPNDSVIDMAKNRRVDIVVLNLSSPQPSLSSASTTTSGA